jgi:hypothetical protein
VIALAVSGSTVYAGGNFTSIGGQGRGGIAALDPTTGLATAWNPDDPADRVTFLAGDGVLLHRQLGQRRVSQRP